jgi:hypothetical protein
MAYGNYSYNNNKQIDFSQLRSVPVIATFNTEGKIRPDYFGYTNPDESVEKLKIKSIKYTREYNHPARMLFCCVYNNYGKQHEASLMFYVDEYMWVLQ